MGTVAKVGQVVDEGTYLYNAPDGQFPKAAAATAFNVAGSWASMEAGAGFGAAIGSVAGLGIFDEITIPVFTVLGGVGGLFGWNKYAEVPIRKWGYTPDANVNNPAVKDQEPNQ